ncbi:hypothetical protein PVAP13_9NG033373 [Panicum virgatum]|uniref:Uncharacterized protein n=1 Tax=Panicum virgatum TaxID=38727 RepID=A0A8T0MGU1_PANVG|nr:hypothetical protein PVAP13_9NG033373 [Panicum virgatum]
MFARPYLLHKNQKARCAAAAAAAASLRYLSSLAHQWPPDHPHRCVRKFRRSWRPHASAAARARTGTRGPAAGSSRPWAAGASRRLRAPAARPPSSAAAPPGTGAPRGCGSPSASASATPPPPPVSSPWYSASIVPLPRSPGTI